MPEVPDRVPESLVGRISDGHFKTLFESSPDPAWIIDGNRFVECNAAAVAVLGYRNKEAFLNLHPSRLSPEFQPDGEDSFTKAERLMGLALARGQHRFEWVHRRADGSCFAAEVTLSAITLEDRPIIYCTWRDISHRKEAEAQLRLAASIMESTSEGIVICDVAGKIISVNPAFTHITGYGAEEAIGRRPSLLKSDLQAASFYHDMWGVLLATGHWEGEIWNRRKNGEAYPEWLTINRLDARDGLPIRFIGVFHDISAQRQADEHIRHLAFHDALTNLPNRSLFRDRLEHAIERARREQNQLAVIFIDLDGFKAVNDDHGHDAGDLLLQDVALRINNHARRGTETVARLGGDEFVVLMENLRDSAQSDSLAQDIIDDISRPASLKGRTVQVGASAGIAIFPLDAESAQGLMKRADMAMYAAKSAGKGCYRKFRPEMLRGTR